jgi:hypothetical protein
VAARRKEVEEALSDLVTCHVFILTWGVAGSLKWNDQSQIGLFSVARHGFEELGRTAAMTVQSDGTIKNDAGAAEIRQIQSGFKAGSWERRHAR